MSVADTALFRDVYIGGAAHRAQAGESVLDTLLRGGVAVPNACRAGACQSCLMRATPTVLPPPSAQVGLRADLREAGYFLACQWIPQENVYVELPGDNVRLSARLVSKSLLSPSVLRAVIRISPSDGAQNFACHPGQYVSLAANFDGQLLSRSYSVARVQRDGVAADLELHIRRVANGRMSSWLFDHADVGSDMWVQGPAGDCFYHGDDPEQTLLLAGTGTGLAPLWGVLHSAIAAEHRGPIVLLHGARTPSGHYLTEELTQLSLERRGHFSYVRCAMEQDLDAAPIAGVAFKPLDTLVLQHLREPKNTRCYLCGDPALVASLRRNVFLAGVPLRQTHCDAFLPTNAAAR